MFARAKRESESTIASIAGSQHCVFLLEATFSTHNCQIEIQYCMESVSLLYI